MASVTWPPRVVAAPSSSSVKVVRARRGTASARRPTSVVRSGGMAAAVVGIGRTGEGGRADARLDTVLNRWRPPRLAPRRRPRHAHAAERVPVNFRSGSYEGQNSGHQQAFDWTYLFEHNGQPNLRM